SCFEGGKDCKNDCQCCGKWSYCKCPIWGLFGCSCVIGDSMVEVRKCQ
nr:RecName: Full=U18-ctenitoxin-Pn1a; Short=U18-CNTX-Pn1a; AltName: Full=Neurotoxin PNTx30C3 [Phoneutria nigriventer]